ncbi:S-layer homology domain-containing protein [Paenibacillus protaetiae]|uniref:SLH domain-containing protein n=1 Tax=Paenibacillus protaetiae TaxID=2509456 RepID=A0A4P6EZD3_9BACL|nr:S-layer homology domain-containing protein [Paenibacillus protaetiae]QAY66077.1 hypothetical protein ET464_06410 [Paenibacillus protaetiae]
MKKQWMAKALLACMALQLTYTIVAGGSQANAADKSAKLPDVRIAVSSAGVKTGDTFEAAIWLQGFTGDYSDIEGYEIRLSYNPELLQPVIPAASVPLQPNVFQQAASPMTLANQFDAAAGNITISQITAKKGSLLFAGYGKVGTVSFKALKEGDAKLILAKSLIIKENNPGVNIIHTINSPVVHISAAGSGSAAADEHKENIGDAPSAKGTTVTAEQALQAYRDFEAIHSITWASDAIAALSVGKVMQGTAAGSFEPSRNMTRAELTKTAVVALHLDMVQQQTPAFPDVSKTAWYYDYIETAAHYGLVQGTTVNGQNVFQPDAPVTRAEIAAIIARVLKASGMAGSPSASQWPFTDVPDSYWATDDLQLLYSLQLMKGVSADKLAPQQYATRAEIAVLLNRLAALL